MKFQTLDLLLKCGRKFGHKRLRDCSLSETECLACTYIYSSPGCTQEAAAQALRMDKTTMAKAMLTLEQKGLICRTRSASDRRKNELLLTEKGQKLLTGILHLHDQWLEQVMSVLSPEEQTQFEAYCLRLLSAAEQLEKSSGNGVEA